MAARISNDGMWRVSYGELNGLNRDEVHLNFNSANQLLVNCPSTHEI
jgi:hypothetical protein